MYFQHILVYNINRETPIDNFKFSVLVKLFNYLYFLVAFHDVNESIGMF